MSLAEREDDVPKDFVLYDGAITEGDYIVYYNDHVLKAALNGGIRLDFENVSPNNDIIKTNNKSIIWHIAPSGSYWTVYNKKEEKYAAGGTK